jgi:tRNA G18 (ribose-2'-O)-methylase SpoU
MTHVNLKRRGYFGVGIYHPKNEINVGTLWRSATIFGASFMFTVGRRSHQQASDPRKSTRHFPLFHFEDYPDLARHVPDNCAIVAIETAGDRLLQEFVHPERAVYMLGAEDYGIPEEILKQCDHVVRLPGDFCLNVSTAGSITIYDRVTRSTK